MAPLAASRYVLKKSILNHIHTQDWPDRHPAEQVARMEMRVVFPAAGPEWPRGDRGQSPEHLFNRAPKTGGKALPIPVRYCWLHERKWY
jgi:hypothetical protein